MLIPTVASAILFWRKIEEEFGVSRKNKGVNKEFGHSEMIGLDHVYDTVEELDNDMTGAHAPQQPGLQRRHHPRRPRQVRHRPRRPDQRHEHRHRRA